MGFSKNRAGTSWLGGLVWALAAFVLMLPLVRLGSGPHGDIWEHGAYLNAPGTVVFDQCTFGPTASSIPDQAQIYNDFGFLADYVNTTVLRADWGAYGGPTNGLQHAILNLPVNLPPGKLHSGNKFIGCSWTAIDKPNGLPGTMRWGIRAFDVDDTTFLRCHFARPMGAAVQIAFRENETIDPNLGMTLGGQHIYRRCTFVDVGDPKSERWGAFTISEHEAQVPAGKLIDVDIVIDTCRFRGGHVVWTDGNGNLVRSSRAIMVHNRRSVTILKTDVLYPDPYDDWALQVWNIDDGDPTTVDVLVDAGRWQEGRMEFRNCGQIVVKNCTGGAYIVVGTGPDGVFPMPNVIYQGPVSAGYDNTGGGS